MTFGRPDPYSVYAVRWAPHPGGRSRPPSAREPHLAYLRAHAERLRFAGPALDDDGRSTGSWAILEGTRAQAERFMRDEPFHVAGSFGEVTIQRFHPKVGARQVDLAPGPDSAMFFCRWPAAVTGPLLGDDDGRVRVLEHGPLTNDEGEEVVGHLCLVEATSPASAQRELLDELTAPTQTMSVDLWRFGNGLSGGRGDTPRGCSTVDRDAEP